MSMKLDTNLAKAADNLVSAISESGKYIGIITRAEALKSTQGTIGLGLSFKSTTGQTADYLDIYTHKANGEALAGAKTANAILACLRLREAKDGAIKCEKWNAQDKKRETVEVNGYPDLMGKRIGLLLQQELQSHQKTGEDVKRMNVFGVFSADSELTASEILDGKTSPERLPRMLEALIARPVRDSRDKAPRTGAAVKPAAARQSTAAGGPAPNGWDDMESDDIPFIVSLNDFAIASGKARRLARTAF